LEQHREEFENVGVNVVAVGLGEPKHAALFGPQLAPSVTCLTRSTPEAHSAYGIGRAGAQSLTQPGILSAALKATAGGHRQGRATGDTRVLSATFVIDRAGVVRFAHYARFPGDDPQIEDILRAAGDLKPEVHV
jgi:peroxiredoxin